MNLARERSLYQEQEIELSHQLSEAIRNVDRYYALSQTQFNRRVAAERNVEAVKAAYDTGTVTLDLVLDAQRRLADAESSYYRSLVDYNLAIRDIHLRKGSLLEYNNVDLAEGPWPGKAYFDARKRARERDAGFFLNYGFTTPKVMSRGRYQQQVHDNDGLADTQGTPTPATQPAEQVPLPSPMSQPPPTPNLPPPASGPAPAALPSFGAVPVLGNGVVGNGMGDRWCRRRRVDHNWVQRLPRPVRRLIGVRYQRKARHQRSAPAEVCNRFNSRQLRQLPMKPQRVTRLLELLSLMQSSRGQNSKALAEKFGVTRRTIFRDLDILRQAGVSLRFDDVDQKFQVAEDNQLPPTRFSNEEALSLLLLCHELGDRRGVPFCGAARTAAAKLEEPDFPPACDNICAG